MNQKKAAPCERGGFPRRYKATSEAEDFLAP
jgi:hypothetical protein